MIVEKRRPHYDLDAFKAAFSTVKGLNATLTAAADAQALGFSRSGMVEVLQAMKAGHFYKSMTSHVDHKVWQDVYHVPWADLVLYVKFTEDRVTAFRLLSFKER